VANFWLSQGPITKAERRQAFRYLRKHDRPINAKTLRHRVSAVRKRNEINRYLTPREEATTDPTNPWQVVYGASMIGGTITFIHTTGNNQYLHLVVTLAAHEIKHVQTVFFDKYAVTWDTDLTTRPAGAVNATGIFAGFVKMQVNYGGDSQSALSELVSDCSDKWTSNHRQRGHAHVYLRLKWSETLFKSGMPDITFFTYGKHDVLDTRTGLTVPAQANTALVLNDYLTNTRWGLGIPQADVNTTRLNDAADDCEDAISLAGGGSENRYLVYSHFGTDESPGQVVEDLLASMAGRLTYTAGKWNVLAGVGRSAVVTITEAHVLSDIQLITKTPRIDSFNSVRGTFVSTQNNWEESDVPVISNSTYVTQDNGETVYEDLTFAHVKSHTMVQRLAKIELESVRQGIMVEFTGTLFCYQPEPGEWVALTFARFGWSGKLFEVLRSALVIEDDENGTPYFAVRLTLKETAAGVFDWNSGNETTFDLAPDTNLPNPFTVAAPTSLTLASGTVHLYTRNDGTVFSRLHVSWTAPADAFVQGGGYVEIQYKKTAASDWQDYGDVPGSSTFAYILDVDDGVSYDVRARGVNVTGSRSAWTTTTGHTVVGKTAPPSDVAGFAGTIQNIGIQFKWTPISDLDLKEYEVRIGTTSDTWATATLAFRTRADRYYYQFAVAGTYRAFIKAIDTSDNYSLNADSDDVTITAPGAVEGLRGWQVDNNVLLDWAVPLTGTLPVAKYEVVRGGFPGAGAQIGAVDGTFFSYVELVGALYYYTVRAVDIVGNVGPETSVPLQVAQPRDFFLHADAFLLSGDATLVNAISDGAPGFPAFDAGNGDLLLPVNASETWSQHFTNNGNATVQDFIDDGHVTWLEPVGTVSGSAQWEVDLGAVLAEANLSFAFQYLGNGSAVTWSITLAYRASGGDPWTEVESAQSPVSVAALATNFRYVRVLIEAAATAATAPTRFLNTKLVVGTKKQTAGGTAAVLAADAAGGGTSVAFGRPFIDVIKITATPLGSSIGDGRQVIVNFTDTPNPVSFQLLLYDKDGNALDGNVSWDAEGLVSVSA
jgi:hypothetical protein